MILSCVKLGDERVMRIEDCEKQVKKEFPFSGYIDNVSYQIVDNIANTIKRYLNPGSKILDFGSGPCLAVAGAS